MSDREKPRDRVMALPGELRRELLYLAHLDPEKQKSTLLHNVAVSGERIQALIDTATREAISEYIEPHLRACRDYNGREWCKNCGLRPLQEQSGGSDDI